LESGLGEREARRERSEGWRRREADDDSGGARCIVRRSDQLGMPGWRRW